MLKYNLGMRLGDQYAVRALRDYGCVYVYVGGLHHGVLQGINQYIYQGCLSQPIGAREAR